MKPLVLNIDDYRRMVAQFSQAKGKAKRRLFNRLMAFKFILS
jgi:hypothetical protein